MTEAVDLDFLVAHCANLLAETAPQEARRLFHGRGQCYPGMAHLVINWWPPCLQVVTFTPEPRVDELIARLAQIPAVVGVVLQHRDGRRTQSEVITGAVDDELLVQEHGLSYWVQPLQNQHAGLFLDMGHVREDLAPHMAGKKVLNLFAYTCAFSVSAIHHGAELVVNNDMNRNMLKWGTRNHETNHHDLRRVRMLPHNLFKSWWKIRQFAPYDLLIIDPPTNQRGSFVAEKNYGAVLKRIPELARPGATVIAALNSPFLDSAFVQQQMARWSPECVYQHSYPLHPDFPDRFPEQGLKVLRYEFQG